MSSDGRQRMLAAMTHPSTALLAGAALAAATLAASPAADAAPKKRRPAKAKHQQAKKKPAPQPKKLYLFAKPDPLAPAGEVPKVLFEAHNVVKGREYRLRAHLVRGESLDTCTGSLGSTTPVKAAQPGVLPFDRTPWDIGESNNGYDVLRGDVCRGAYEGELEERGGRIPRSLDFVLSVPEMTLDVVERRG